MAAVPPFARGNSVSITLCPVMSGTFGGSFFTTGLAILTGHFCASIISLLPLSVFTIAMVSVTL